MAVEAAAATREDRFTFGPKTLRQCYVAYSVIDKEICCKAVLTSLVKSSVSQDNSIVLENIIC